MTTRPRLYRGSKIPGLLAIALFAVLAGVFLAADLGDAVGFPGVESITAAIGYAMFNIDAAVVPEGTEGFLVAFIVIAVVLDAALDAAVMLARREEDMSLPFTGDGTGADADGDAADRDDSAGEGLTEGHDAAERPSDGPEAGTEGAD